MPWDAEAIPDEDTLYQRVHQANFADGELLPGAFREQNHGMSTDWSRYSTAEEARQRARETQRNAVVALSAGGVRSITGIQIEHAPLDDNRAHTNVHGVEATKARKLLKDLARVVIPVKQP